jgi:hypothetical protein
MARAIAVPVDFVGGVRSRSSSETRLPSGTSSRATSAGASVRSAFCAAVATVAYRRRSATVRASDTCRASTETPGSSTRLRRSHVTAWLNSATGPSACIHARPYKKVRNSSTTSGRCSPGTRTAPGSPARGCTASSGAPRTASRTRSPRCRAARPGSPRPPTAPPAGRPQERADVPHRADLHRHAKAMPAGPSQRDQVAVVVGQEEEPLQLGARGSLAEGPVGSGLLISQKFHRHGRTVAALRVRSNGLSPKLPTGAVRCGSRP